MNSVQKDRLFYICVFLLSVLLLYLPGSSRYVLYSDSYTYMDIFEKMEGIMPVYSLFLHGNKVVFGEDIYLYAVAVEQTLLAAVCVTVFVGTIKKQFSLTYVNSLLCAVLALLPFTTDMPEGMSCRVILTEGLAYAVYYLFMTIMLRSVWKKSVKNCILLWLIVLFMSLVRSQLQILFGVCGVVLIYILMCKRKSEKRDRKFLVFCVGVVGCIVMGVAGVSAVIKINNGWDLIRDRWQAYTMDAEWRALEEEGEVEQEESTVAGQESDAGEETIKPTFGTSQYATLIFARGMYEADYEDYRLFEGEEMQELYLRMYQKADEAQCLYSYASPGLWMWKDIMNGIGAVGGVCFLEQAEYYRETSKEYLYGSRNEVRVEIGLKLLQHHFGRFLYHTIMMLPQAFICTVFFQIKEIYLLCHLITLFLYLAAVILMIWAYADKKVENAYGEMMAAVLGTNLIMIVVVSLVFFGQQRYLVYNFGIFYISGYLLFLQFWKYYGKNLVKKVTDRFYKRNRNGE